MIQGTVNPQNQPGTTVIIQNEKSNGIGTTGFVLALIALFSGWVPFLDWIIWLLGLIFSAVGVFREPKGLAIATGNIFNRDYSTDRRIRKRNVCNIFRD